MSNQSDQHTPSKIASAHAESARFGLHPRLTESWRGFYFYYPFAGQRVAFHAWAEVAF